MRWVLMSTGGKGEEEGQARRLDCDDTFDDDRQDESTLITSQPTAMKMTPVR